MSSTRPNPLALSRKTLKVAIAVNLLMGVLVLAFLVASLIASSAVFGTLGVRASDGNEALIGGMRMIMVIGIVSVPLVHLILSRLLGIVLSIADGDPFMAENAARMRAIAWTLLGFEVLHFMVGTISAWISTTAQPFSRPLRPSAWRSSVSQATCSHSTRPTHQKARHEPLHSPLRPLRGRPPFQI